MGEQLRTIPETDYLRLLQACEADDTIVRCDTCGAWLDINESASNDDFTGCWKAATGDSRYDETCRSYRAPDSPTFRPSTEPAGQDRPARPSEPGQGG